MHYENFCLYAEYYKKPKKQVTLYPVCESVAIMNTNTDNCLQTNMPPKGKKATLSTSFLPGELKGGGVHYIKMTEVLFENFAKTLKRYQDPGWCT